ncbi:MAG TPA: hypothetical protein VIU61_13835 [Kofleriaceae bacterium]
MNLDELFGAALEVPGVLTIDEVAAVRDRLERRGYTRHALIDRGLYDLAPDPDEPALFDRMLAHATRLIGVTLAVIGARAIRLGPGDYVLAHHDPPHANRPVELVLDLSPRPVPGAELHYRRRGQVYFRFACTPGALAIVERGPTVTSNHTYVSKRDASASVVRLVVQARAG